MPKIDITQDDRLWTIDDIAEYLQVSKSTVEHKVLTSDTFPSPVRIGHPRWYPSEVKHWVAKHR